MVTKLEVEKNPFLVKKDAVGNVLRTRVSGQFGGEILGSIQQTNDGLSYLVEGPGITISSGSSTQGQITFIPTLNLIPSPNFVAGTTTTIVGAFYAKIWTYDSARALLGSSNAGDTGTLVIREYSTTNTILVLNGTGNPSSQSSTGSVIFPAEGWYGIYLYNSSALTNAICYGLQIIG